MLHHHGLDVDVAEAARAVDHLHGVMPGRTDHGKGAVAFALHDEVRGLHGSACGDEVRAGGHGADLGKAEMDALHILDGGHVGLVLGDTLDVEEPFLAQLVLGVEQPLLPLGVGGRDGPVKGGEKDDAERFVCLEHG
jgi:hypothetical protein